MYINKLSYLNVISTGLSADLFFHPIHPGALKIEESPEEMEEGEAPSFLIQKNILLCRKCF